MNQGLSVLISFINLPIDVLSILTVSGVEPIPAIRLLPSGLNEMDYTSPLATFTDHIGFIVPVCEKRRDEVQVEIIVTIITLVIVFISCFSSQLTGVSSINSGYI